MDLEKDLYEQDSFNLDEIKQLLGDEVDEEIASMSEEEILKSLEQEEQEPAEEAETSGEDEDQVTMEELMDDEEADSEEGAPKEKKKLNFGEEIYGMLHDVIYLLAAVTLIFVYLVRLVGVQGDSMYPTLHDQDYLLLESNALYSGTDIESGDIVVLTVPYFEERKEGPIVKRVIATEGQTVDIDFRKGTVYVDGVQLYEDYINEPATFDFSDYMGGDYSLDYPFEVPENHVFVLGDNRNNSLDSRYAPIGAIDERCVLGKVVFLGLPGESELEARDWGRMGLVH